MRAIREIIIHCSATRPEWMNSKPKSDYKSKSFEARRKIVEIRKWHIARGFRDIGYHIIIDRSGAVVDGRPMDQVGAHVKGHNTGTIGVCLIGGHGSDADDKFEEHFTPAQEKALMATIGNLKAMYGNLKVSGHNEYSNKACPGFRVKEWLSEEAPDDILNLEGEPPMPSKRPALSSLISWFARWALAALIKR